jgi:hypothetical protein
MKDKTNIITAVLIGLTVGLAITLMSIKSNKNTNSDVRKISVHKTFNVRRQINDSTTVYTDSTVWYEDED